MIRTRKNSKVGWHHAPNTRSQILIILFMFCAVMCGNEARKFPNVKTSLTPRNKRLPFALHPLSASFPCMFFFFASLGTIGAPRTDSSCEWDYARRFWSVDIWCGVLRILHPNSCIRSPSGWEILCSFSASYIVWNHHPSTLHRRLCQSNRTTILSSCETL